MTDLIRIISDGIAPLVQGWFAKAIIAIFVAAVGPLQDGYTALMILMFLDLVLGIYRAVNERRLNGRIARYKTVVKLMVYWSVIAASYQLSIITSEELPVRVAVFYLGATEFLSVYRNGMAVLGRPPLPSKWVDELEERLGVSHDDNKDA